MIFLLKDEATFEKWKEKQECYMLTKPATYPALICYHIIDDEIQGQCMAYEFVYKSDFPEEKDYI